MATEITIGIAGAAGDGLDRNDIEQALVLGAHGPRTMSLILASS